jgi:hypothetical protein
VRNYFKEVVDEINEVVETVDGVFQCQEQLCFDIVEEAVYNEAMQLLTWTCEEGHDNKIEGFEL